MEGEITLLEPQAVLYGSRLRTFDPNSLLSTWQPKSFWNTRFCGPRHLDHRCCTASFSEASPHPLETA